MKGMNAATGRALCGLAHLYQSIDKILTTPLATCIQRRQFGAAITDLMDAPNNGDTQLRLYAAIATALMRWEPRLTLTRVQVSIDAGSAQGRQVIDIEGYTTVSGDAVSTRINLAPRGIA
jgi:phage baseplate assembly protein W